MKIIIIIGLLISGIYLLDKYHIDSNHGVFYNERIHNIANAFIENAINTNKIERISWLAKDGFTTNEISEKMWSLENDYKKERLKIYEYCKLDDLNIIDYFTGFRYRYKNCYISHDWTDKNGANFVHFKYTFDKESSELFNEIKLIYHKSIDSEKKVKNIEWYEARRIGLNTRQLFLDRTEVSVGAIDFDYEMIPFMGDINKVNKNKHKIWSIENDKNN